MARLLPRWWLQLVGTIVAAVALVVVVGATTADATTNTYDVRAVVRVDGHLTSVADAAQPQVSHAREESASPSVGALGTSTTPARSFIATDTVDGLAAQARVARDELAASTGSRHATVTGAYDPTTGRVVAGASGPGFCAETSCVRQLVEAGSDPANVRFVEAIRPRTGLQVPVCTRCQGMYQPSQFPVDVQFQTPGPWSGPR
jgi:hypothetical protein